MINLYLLNQISAPAQLVQNFDTQTLAFSFVKIAFCVFFAILFIQSGLDKISDRNGNLSWLQGHFANSPFKNLVPILLTTITFFELAAGVFSAMGVMEILVGAKWKLGFTGAILSAASLLMLFLGQRIAKDYAGAATLVNYFIASIIAIIVLA